MQTFLMMDAFGLEIKFILANIIIYT